MPENQGNSAQKLSLDSTSEAVRWVDPDVTKAARVMAVLELHEKLQYENGGKSPKTLRQLLMEHVNLHEGLLLSYISAFGAHGKTVITRFIQNQPERGQAQYEEELRAARQTIAESK